MPDARGYATLADLSALPRTPRLAGQDDSPAVPVLPAVATFFAEAGHVPGPLVVMRDELAAGARATASAGAIGPEAATFHAVQHSATRVYQAMQWEIAMDIAVRNLPDRTLTVPLFDGEESVSITYRPSVARKATTLAQVQQIQGGDFNALVAQLAAFLSGWDLTNNGRPLPITLTSLFDLDAEAVLMPIFLKIWEDVPAVLNQAAQAAAPAALSVVGTSVSGG